MEGEESGMGLGGGGEDCGSLSGIHITSTSIKCTLDKNFIVIFENVIMIFGNGKDYVSGEN